MHHLGTDRIISNYRSGILYSPIIALRNCSGLKSSNSQKVLFEDIENNEVN